MIDYYLARWKHLNLLTFPGEELQDRQKRIIGFQHSPATLLDFSISTALSFQKMIKTAMEGVSPL
jgi:hypothetical protein